MLVALGVAVTASKVTAALVEVDIPSLGPVDERVTPLADSSATVGEVVAAAIGVMRLRAIQNGLGLRGTVVSSANSVQRESISAELKMHKIDDVDVVDATYLSPAFEPSVSTAMWNVDGVGRVARNPVQSDEMAKPVKASRMEKFGMAHQARSAEKAFAADRVTSGDTSSSRVEERRFEQARITDNARTFEDLARPVRTVPAPSSTTTGIEKIADDPSRSPRPAADAESTPDAVEVPKAELAIPYAIAAPPVARQNPGDRKPSVLNLGDDVEAVSSDGRTSFNGSYSGVGSYADTAETTAIDSAAIVAAVGAGFTNSSKSAAPDAAARRSPPRPAELQIDPYDSPMTVPINIVGPMVTRPAEADNRERGAALIIAVVVSLVLAGVLAIWAISGAVKTSEPDVPGDVGVSSPLTSESSAAVVPPAAVPAPAPDPGAITEPTSDPSTDSTDPTDSTGEVIDPSVDVEGAPAVGVPARSNRTVSTQGGSSSSIASNQVSAPVNNGATSGRPSVGGVTAPTKAAAKPVETPSGTATGTVSVDPVTPADPSPSEQTGVSEGQPPTNASE